MVSKTPGVSLYFLLEENGGGCPACFLDRNQYGFKSGLPQYTSGPERTYTLKNCFAKNWILSDFHQFISKLAGIDGEGVHSQSIIIPRSKSLPRFIFELESYFTFTIVLFDVSYDNFLRSTFYPFFGHIRDLLGSKIAQNWVKNWSPTIIRCADITHLGQDPSRTEPISDKTHPGQTPFST